MKKNVFYTKHYITGDKMIFSYKGKAKEKDMVRVNMFCSDTSDEYEQDSEIYVGLEGTSEGARVELSTKEEIDLLLSIHYKKLVWKLSK